MKHSTRLADALLRTHFVRRPDADSVVRYHPITAEAHDHWIHTGVCPGCLARSVSVGRCAECGWRSSCRGCRFLIPTGHEGEGLCHCETSIHVGGLRSPAVWGCRSWEIAQGTVCLCGKCGKLLDVVEAWNEKTGKLVPIPKKVFCGECSKKEE